jgi:hypothetical protein
MAEDRSLTRLQHWYGLLQAERTRRRDSNGRGDAIREQLIARLDEMARRLRAAPDFVELAPVENREFLNAWLREHG